MLIVLDKADRYINAADIPVKEKSHQYYCPACRKPVIFRSGPRTIAHFAHQKNEACIVKGEPETIDHLTGKQLIYNWVQSFSKTAELEKYLPSIKQRPDVYAVYNKHPYAIEYQCSPLGVDIFQERTRGYKNIGIEPIWCFHERFIRRKGEYLWSLNSILQSAIRRTGKHTLPYLLFHTPVLPAKMTILYNLIPFSKDQWFGQIRQISCSPNTTFTFHQILQIPSARCSYLAEWFRKRTKLIRNQLRYQGFKSVLNRELYQYGLFPQSLPDFIGVPMPHGYMFHMSALEWQGLLYIDLLTVQKKWGVIRRENIQKCLVNRVKQNEIILTITPFILQDIMAALDEYLEFLEKIEYLRKINDNHYIIEYSFNNTESRPIILKRILDLVEGYYEVNGEM